MNRPPVSVQVTKLLMLLSALFWLGFAIFVALGMIASISALGIMRWIMVFLALVGAAALGALALSLRKGSPRAYYLAAGLLAVIVVLSITDQIGVLDLLSLLACLIPLVLLVRDRAWYVGKGSGGPT